MSTLDKNATDFREINAAAFDLFKRTSQQWMELINRSFAKSGEEKENVKPWLALGVMKLWSDKIMDFNGRNAAMQKIIASSLEQQKLCSSLTKSWFDCAAKTMEAIRKGAQNDDDPAETMKICESIAADYRRCCADFIENECAQICAALRAGEADDEKNEKAAPGKAKTRAEK